MPSDLQDQYQQHPGQHAAPQDQQAPTGLNPAAVAALLPLTQFAGNMDAAEWAAGERAMAERQWGPQYHQYPMRPPTTTPLMPSMPTVTAMPILSPTLPKMTGF